MEASGAGVAGVVVVGGEALGAGSGSTAGVDGSGAGVTGAAALGFGVAAPA